jgi:hypothetical protein
VSGEGKAAKEGLTPASPAAAQRQLHGLTIVHERYVLIITPTMVDLRGERTAR